MPLSIPWLGALITLFLAACKAIESPIPSVAPSASVSPGAAAITPTFVSGSPSTPVPQHTALSSETYRAEETLLQWESHTPLGDGDAERCQRLVITSDHQVHYGMCSGKPRTAQISALNLDDMLAQFSAFEHRSHDTTLMFRGHGRVAGDIWQRAIATWAGSTFGELYSGRACAACRTVLAWSFGSIPTHSGFCGMLVVLNYGYAYKQELPCGGHDAKGVAQGWLTTQEWTQLEDWVEGRSSAYASEDTSHMIGKGSRPMSSQEMATLAEWAQKVYRRLQ